MTTTAPSRPVLRWRPEIIITIMQPATPAEALT